MTQTTKAFVYIIAVNLILFWLGYAIGERQGLILSVILALGLNYLFFFAGDALILWTYRARPLEGRDPYGIMDALGGLSRQLGVPTPKLYIVESDSPNCFSIGWSPRQSAIVVTHGLIQVLNEQELRGVLAQQLQHILTRQVFLKTVTGVVGSLIIYVAEFFRWVVSFGKARPVDAGTARRDPVGHLIFAFFAPFAALAIRSGIRESRDFQADSDAAALTQNPQAYAQALWKIHHYAKAQPLPATLATAHLFIVNPFAVSPWMRLFKTHPPVEERIKRLIGRYPY